MGIIRTFVSKYWTVPAPLQHGFITTTMLGLVLSACLPQPMKPASELEMESALTSAAGTIGAEFTLQAGESAIAQLTDLAGQANATFIADTPVPLATGTPLPPTIMASATPTFTPTATQPAVPCDQASLVAEISAPADALLVAGAPFLKTWRVQNTGSCTWNSAYSVALVSGSALGAFLSPSLSKTVQPGETIDITIPMSAPLNPGVYESSWMLTNANDEMFGIAENLSGALTVRIQVIKPIAWDNAPYDFSLNFCAAEWISGFGALGCPSLLDDSYGWVSLLERPTLENRQTEVYGVWTRPNAGSNGWISSRFPNYLVKINDHFIAEASCLFNSAGCNVTFQLDYWQAGAFRGRLGQWQELYDGKTTMIDVDLSALAGQIVQLVLSVSNNGDPASANAVWLAPRIQNVNYLGKLVIDWTRQVGGTTTCDELHVYLTVQNTAEALALSCAPGGGELGKLALSREDLNQLLYWIGQLKRFDAEVYNAFPNMPIISWLNFYGQGSGNALDADIQAINNFAAKLFDLIVK